MTHRTAPLLMCAAILLDAGAARAAPPPTPAVTRVTRVETPPSHASSSSSAADQSWASGDGSPAVDTRWTVAPLLGVSTNGLNLGLGVRGGKTLDNRVYLGGTFVYNTGGSTTVYPYAGYAGYPYTQYTSYAATSSWSVFYLGPEGGYDFSVSQVVLRPYLGLGLAQASVSSSATAPAGAPAPASVSGSASSLALWPGFAALYDIPRSTFFVGGDVRLLLATGGALQGGGQSAAVGFFASGGAKFGQ